MCFTTVCMPPYVRVVLLAIAVTCAQCLFTSDYPESIPVVSVRIDAYSKKPVTSGHLHGMPEKVKLKDFKKLLQCSINEPDFDYNSGSLSLIKTIPPTKDLVELMCAYGENKCPTWDKCQADRLAYKMNPSAIPSQPYKDISYFQRFRLFRVINGSLYYDWAWRVDRLNYEERHHFKEVNEIVPLMRIVLEKISDMPDCVFFAGCENPVFPYHFPFPIFSSATSVEFADMPWPWIESLKAARGTYYTEMKSKNPPPFTFDQNASLVESRKQWTKKTPKAAFFASWDAHRMIMMDAGRRYPDLFDVAFSFPYHACLPPFNPQSKEPCLTGSMKDKIPKETLLNASTSSTSGYILPLLNVSEGRSYIHSNYKYIIVPTGGAAKTLSGRLAGLLASSGAVILLQRTAMAYHFSARLKPWVHYVPLTFSGADVVEKVKWLRDHDDLARQIAENGRAFARSYLRLEDYYCYAAAALEVVGELEKGSDALQPFDPQPLGPLSHMIPHVNASGHD